MKSVAPVLKGNVCQKSCLLFLVIKLTPVYFTSATLGLLLSPLGYGNSLNKKLVPCVPHSIFNTTFLHSLREQIVE